eukprot:g5226.t1
MDTVFRNIETGSGICMKRRSLLTIVRSEIEGSQNEEGGFILSSGEVHIRNTHFIQNTGGCIFANNSKLTLRNSDFDQNTAINGAAVSMISDRKFSQVNIRKCSFRSNTAEDGGALFLNGSGHLNLSNNTFLFNEASGNGGAIYLNGLSINITNCTFMQNQAGILPFVIDRICPLSLNGILEESLSQGGAIYMTNAGLIESTSCNCFQSIFQNNSAPVGGALSLPLDNNLQIESSRFYSNTGQFGGACFLNASFNSSMKLNSAITDTVFENNTACFGGALYGTEAKNNSTVLEEVSFLNNNAIRSGSAIYAVHPAPFSFLCNTTGVTQIIPFTHSLTTETEEHCGNVLLTNQTDVASRFLFSTNAVELVVQPDHIANHRSGEFLPVVHIRYVDAFNQTVTYSQLLVTIHAPDDQPNITLQGQMTAILTSGETQLDQVLLSALPGEYQLIISLQPTIEQTLVVTVDDCLSTERREELICQPCPSGVCQSCPDHAVCEGNIIIPVAGYWSPGPESEHISKCVRFESCDRNAHSFLPSGSLSTINYTSVPLEWCNKGYEGILCGSCETSFGHIAGYECIKCRDGLGEFFTFFVTIYTFLIVLILIKTSWFSDLNPALTPPRSPLQEQTRPVQEIEMEAVVCEIEAEDSPVSQHVEPRASFGIKEVTGELSELRKKISEGTVSRNMRQTNVDGPGAVQQTNEDRNQILTPLSGVPLTTIESIQNATVLAKPFVSECVKIITTFLQTSSLALYIQIHWSEASTGLLRTLGKSSMSPGCYFDCEGFLGGHGSTFVSLDCWFDRNNGIPASLKARVFILVMPVGLALVLVSLWILLSVFVDRSLSVLWQRIKNTFVAIFYFTFLPITHTCFKLLQCESVDGNEIDDDAQFWIEDTELECWRGSHMNAVYYICIPLLVIVSVGLPFSFMVFLLSHKTLGKTERLRTWGLLYEAYKYKRRYWELLVFTRKTLLALIFGFGYHFSIELQSLGAMGVCICFLVIHAIASPYEKSEKRLDRMEVLSLFGSIIVFFFASLINALDDRYQILFIMFIIITCLVMFQLLVGLWIHLVRSVDWTLADFGRNQDHSKPFMKKLAIVVGLRASDIFSRIQGFFRNCLGCLKGKCSFT